MNYEHWEKRVDNGAIGEARTKELIIDRFWVLERSIDRDGADFLVQRKLTNISSIDPPRFGIIQSKFRENVKNIIEISKNYVNGAFFLFVHTGIEDFKKVYFLKSSDIEQFHIKDGFYKVKVLERNYEIESIASTLDEIEDGILSTEVENNQQFAKEYFTGSYYEARDIDEDYDLGILESYKVMSNVKRIKEKTFEIIEEFMYHMTPLKEILEVKNPRNLLYLYDDMFDRLNINTDSAVLGDILKSYEEDFKNFYYDNKEEIYEYDKYIKKLGKNKLYILKKLKQIILKEIESAFKRQNIESEDEIYVTGFDLEFKVNKEPNIKINNIWTEKADKKYKNYSGKICDVNIIKENNEINFCVCWSVHKDIITEELRLDNIVSYQLGDFLTKVASFITKEL